MCRAFFLEILHLKFSAFSSLFIVVYVLSFANTASAAWTQLLIRMSFVKGRMGKFWDNAVEVGRAPFQRLQTNLQKHWVAQFTAEDTSKNAVVKTREARCNNAIDETCIKARQTVASQDKLLTPSVSDWLIISILDS
ncbi:hypothetical protein O6H91_02G124100 [Diphasiastrum complanatum]|uniref:Uncharacterized protein n=1 Tax=Diphasiastrum complanatum TaxID=34168 RepID=A0ACC2EKK5_DIPCM|nr:hypothetical protein O6H91_02G124100 [Diphasiastrum complanatum]